MQVMKRKSKRSSSAPTDWTIMWRSLDYVAKCSNSPQEKLEITRETKLTACNVQPQPATLTSHPPNPHLLQRTYSSPFIAMLPNTAAALDGMPPMSQSSASRVAMSLKLNSCRFSFCILRCYQRGSLLTCSCPRLWGLCVFLDFLFGWKETKVPADSETT